MEDLALILIPFFLFIPLRILGGIGIVVLNLGIVIARATKNFLDISAYCPNYGDVVEEENTFVKNVVSPS